MTGFIPDIIKVLQEFDLLGYIADYLINGSFPSKSRRKNIVKSAVYGKDQNDWVKKISKKSQLNFFLSCHPLIWISKWYELWYLYSVARLQWRTTDWKMPEILREPAPLVETVLPIPSIMHCYFVGGLIMLGRIGGRGLQVTSLCPSVIFLVL